MGLKILVGGCLMLESRGTKAPDATRVCERSCSYCYAEEVSLIPFGKRKILTTIPVQRCQWKLSARFTPCE